MTSDIPIRSGNPADAFEWAVRCAKCRDWIPVDSRRGDFLDALDIHECDGVSQIARLTTERDEAVAKLREVRPVFDWPPPKEVAQVYEDNKRLVADLAAARAALEPYIERNRKMIVWLESNEAIGRSTTSVQREREELARSEAVISRLGTGKALAAVREVIRQVEVERPYGGLSLETMKALARLRAAFGEGA